MQSLLFSSCPYKEGIIAVDIGEARIELSSNGMIRALCLIYTTVGYIDEIFNTYLNIG